MTPPTPPLSCEYEANININMKSADTNMLATLPYETDPNLHKPACEKKVTSLNGMNSNSAAKSLEELKAIQPQEETFPQQLMNLLESETYIGGKVECLETGVYRSDIEYKFDMNPAGFQGLIDNVDRDMTFAIEVEGGIDRRKITNYDEVCV